MVAPRTGPEYNAPAPASAGATAPEQAPPAGLLALLETEPARFVSDRLLLILALALAAAVILTALVAWWIWHTPALVPVDLESVPRA